VCQQQFEADQSQTISPCCSRPLLEYDPEAIARDEIAQREATMWR
jgi:hypothetical protein